jgi:hypothetical protein
LVGAVGGSNSVEDDSRSRFETLELEKDHQEWLLSLSLSSKVVAAAAAAVPRSSADDAVVVRPVNSYLYSSSFLKRLTKAENRRKPEKLEKP